MIINFSVISYKFDLNSKDIRKKLLFLIYTTINVPIYHNNKLSEHYILFNPLTEHSY